MFEILEAEGIKYERAAVADVVKRNFPDFRRTINTLQKYAARSNQIDVGILAGNRMSYDELVTQLRSKDWKGMRKWCAEHEELELASLIDFIYSNIETRVEPRSRALLVQILAEYDSKDALVVNKQVNLVAMLTTIMQECTFIR
jgi:replication factor C small subunit